jgi:late competence protein required for DNA uptake (superfamily II DNA/RNA helicase)
MSGKVDPFTVATSLATALLDLGAEAKESTALSEKIERKSREVEARLREYVGEDTAKALVSAVIDERMVCPRCGAHGTAARFSGIYCLPCALMRRREAEAGGGEQ